MKVTSKLKLLAVSAAAAGAIAAIIPAAPAFAQAKAQAAIAKEFDGVHTVERAFRVGSLDAVIAPQTLRAGLVARLRAT